VANDASLAWGIIGPGQIAGVFAESVVSAGAGRIVAAYGRDAGRRAAFCARHGGRPEDSLTALVSHPEVDAVYVATPHAAHAESVQAALAAGKAVLCEKPLTTSSEATAALWTAAEAYEGLLVEGWMYRAHPQVRRLAELLHAGAIGRPLRLHAAFGFVADADPAGRLLDPALGGGGILDIGGYPVSLALHCASAVDGVSSGEVAEARDAKYDTLPEDIVLESGATGVDVDARCVLRFANGFVSHLRVSLQEDLPRPAVVEGTDGRILVTDPFLPGGERRGIAATLRLEPRNGAAHEETLVARHDCFALEAFEVARLLRSRAAGLDARDPAWPMVGRQESLAIAGLLDAWKAGA